MVLALIPILWDYYCIWGRKSLTVVSEVTFLRESNSVSYLMSHDQIFKSSEKCWNIRWLQGWAHDYSCGVFLKYALLGDMQKTPNAHIHHPESLYGLLVVDVSAKRQKERLFVVIRIRIMSHLWTVKKRKVFFTVLNAQKLLSISMIMGLSLLRKANMNGWRVPSALW